MGQCDEQEDGQVTAIKVIGCGTGRSGTLSLSRIIGRCRGMYCTHEAAPLLPWEWNEHLYRGKVALLRDSPDSVGDVYFAYLPYLRRLFDDVDGLRVVCMERDREQVIRSYVGWTRDRNVNHWMRHDGTRWNRHGWDTAYPKFDATSKEEALGMYWDFYYHEIRAIRDEHPDAVMVLPVEELNTEEGQSLLFDFLDMPAADRYYSTTTKLHSIHA